MSPVSGTKKTNIPAQVMPPAPDLNKQKNINPKSVSIFKELIKE
jgi:hypothetical protein